MGQFHRAIPVTAVTFLALLVSAAVRSAPSVLLLPLHLHFGWDRGTISATAALGIFLYGLVGPFAAAMMLTVGIRRTMMAGLTVMAATTFASQWMTQSWQFLLSWGVFSGLGSGAVASVLGAAVVNRWYAKRQGLAMGILSASTATGALIFLPFLAWLTRAGAWQPVVMAVGIACLVLVPLVAIFVPEHPEARRPMPPRRAASRPARCWHCRCCGGCGRTRRSGCCSARSLCAG